MHVGEEIKKLLSNLSEHSCRHLDEVQTDLAQTSYLLSEAIEKLSASFMAMHEAICLQQEKIDAVLSAHPVDAHVCDALRASQAQIDLHINSAVTGLQFQDMTNQLLSRTSQRVTGLHDVLISVGAQSGLVAQARTEDVFDGLVQVHASLEHQSIQLENALWKAVCQTHMESGDIELF